jgi:ribose-phosphate pyrophosphokinase
LKAGKIKGWQTAEVMMVKALNEGIAVICGQAHPVLGQEIADFLKVKLTNVKVSRFPDSETHVQVEDSVRGKDVYIIQPTCEPVNDTLMELLITIDACKRASAHQITVVAPYYGYGRQDHKSTGREPITARLVADLISVAGANRIISMDLHAAAIQGFFDIPMDHLTAVPILAKYLKKFSSKNSIIVAPDAGRTKMAEKYTDVLQWPMAIMTKRRKGIGGKELGSYTVLGDVKGKTAVIIDDVIAGGSILKEVAILFEAGAKEVYLSITHPMLVGSAIELLKKSAVKKLIVTNTIPVSDENLKCGKIEVLSVAPLLGEVIYNIHNNKSVSSLFLKEHLVFPV